MPKKTFFNLPEEKRLKLINAIKDEFTRVPFSEVSINKIIKKAEISRGSFYQYFEDKDDMLDFIISNYKDDFFKKAINIIKDKNGDIFESFKELFNVMLEIASKAKVSKFVKHIFSDVKIVEKFLDEENKENNDRLILKEIMPKVNLNILNIKNEEDFKRIVEILVAVTKNSYMKVFMNLSEIETVKKDYFEKLEFLKYGLLKKI